MKRRIGRSKAVLLFTVTVITLSGDGVSAVTSKLKRRFANPLYKAAHIVLI